MGALVLFFLAACSLVVAAAGVHWQRVDSRLRARIEGQALAGSGTATRRNRPRPPRMLLARGRDLAEIEQGLRLAGHFDPAAVELFVWFRAGATLVAFVAAVMICWMLNGHPFRPVLAPIAAAGLTWIAAKYALKARAKSRERTLTIEFPFLLDLMLMMLESGISLDQCLRAIARDEQVAVPRHARLMGMLVDDLDRGQDYQHAFDRWAARVAVSGAKELSAMFRQSLFQGMELVPALREFIREFSQRRVAKAREAIGMITVRMVVLMLIFFMPALFIVLAGPPVAAIFDTLGGKP